MSMSHVGSGSVRPAVPLVSDDPVRRDDLQQEQERDRDDHERRPARAQRDHAEQRRDEPGDDAGDRHPQPQRDVDRVDEDAERVGAEAEERALAERHVAGVAGDDVQPAPPRSRRPARG